MINLPQKKRERAIFRIQYLASQDWSAQSWTTLAIPAIIDRSTGEIAAGTVAQGGYHVKSITRWCLPDEDRADFYIDTGIINGVSVSAIDLSGRDIRIQVYNNEFGIGASGSLPGAGWKTVFIGTVYTVQHDKVPGDTIMGRSTYHCAGILWRTRSWPLSKHSCDGVTHADGHPGYNYALHGMFRNVLGNMDTATVDPTGELTGSTMDSYYRKHKLPIDRSDNAKWTDMLAIKHALASSKPKKDIFVEVALPSDLFGGKYAWPVYPGDSCFDFIARLCNRNRGRGAVYVEYTGDDNSNSSIRLRAVPSFMNSINYPRTLSSFTASDDMLLMPETGGMSGAAYGAGDTVGNAVDVDISGDHRVVGNFSYQDRSTFVYDYFETRGARIQVCCNLNFFYTTMEKRWTASEEASFKAIPLDKYWQRQSPRWRHVWRRFGPKSGSLDTVKSDPNDATAQSIAFVMSPTTGNISTSSGISTQLTFTVLPDIPVYEGWDYSVHPPARYDGGSDYMPPARLQSQVLLKADYTYTDVDGSHATWAPLSGYGFSLQADPFGFLIIHSDEDSAGVRYLAKSADAPYAYADIGIKGCTTTSGIDLNNLNTIIGIEIGSYMSFAKSNAAFADCKRRHIMTVNGPELWLGVKGGIYDIDPVKSVGTNRRPGLRFPNAAGSQAAVVIRDDRNELSFIHALASAYFTEIHNPAQWKLADCGLITSFTSNNKQIAYPTIGVFVGNVTYSGDEKNKQTVAINTNVTCIHYDHDAGTTEWRTDYISYDGNTQ